MQITRSVHKILQILVAMVFVTGSSVIVKHFYHYAYDDLPTYYWATHLAFDDGASAYQPHYFQQLGQTLGRKIYPFLYPPPSLLLFTPFLLGDYEHIKTVFTLCNLVLWWWLTWLLYRLYCFYLKVDNHAVAGLLIPLWSLIFVPVLDTFRTGQINLFVLICMMPLLFQPSRGWQQVASGALLAIAIVLKVYLLLVLPVLIIMGQKKIWGWTLGTLILLCTVSVWWLPRNLWLDWLALGHDSGAYGKQLPNVMTIPWNQSLNGFFVRQFLDEKILSGTTHWHWLVYSGSSLLLVVTFYTVSRKLRQDAHGISVAAVLIFLVMLLIAPLTWQHHFVFAMPAMVCCFAWLARRGERLLMLMAVLFGAVISAPSLISVIFPDLAAMKMVDKTLPLGANLVVSAQLLAGLGFWGLFCLLVICRGSALPEMPSDKRS